MLHTFVSAFCKMHFFLHYFFALFCCAVSELELVFPIFHIVGNFRAKMRHLHHKESQKAALCYQVHGGMQHEYYIVVKIKTSDAVLASYI